MITYNHGPFIAQALDSILQQKVQFTFEIVIGEDNSTDNTREVLQQYANRHPGIIRLLLHPRNIGAMNNQTETLKNCRGKYIAYLEGDDYWSDINKLQKQVDFLETHAAFNACFHNVAIIDETTHTGELVYEQGRKNEIGLADLAEGDYMKTCSLLSRNMQQAFTPMYDGSIPSKDTSIGYCLLFNGGKAKYFEDTMAVYRKHAGGIVGKATHEKKILYSLSCLKKYRGYYHDEVLKPALDHLYRFQCKQLLRISVRHMKPVQAMQSFWGMLFG